jgi:hypothetical protein
MVQQLTFDGVKEQEPNKPKFCPRDFYYPGRIDIEYRVNPCTVQDVYKRRTKKALVQYVYYDRHKKGRFVTRNAKKLLKQAGVRGEHIRYIGRLSFRMCARAAFPDKTWKASKQWQQRYTTFLENLVGFYVPQHREYIEVTMSVYPENPHIKSGTLIFAYHPETGELFKLNSTTWKSLDMELPVRMSHLEQLQRRCVHVWRRHIQTDHIDT